MDLNIKARWIEQLYKEFDHLCWFYKIHLRPPLIVVDDVKSFYGKWDPLTRQITLSETMIQKHSWDIVLEVFKHELAHQVVHEILHVDSSLHDEFFAQACDMLAVEYWARTASGDLPEGVESKRQNILNDDEQQLFRRIEKLLNLAQSTNEHEASLAMQRVHEIYQKYNLSQFDQLKNPEFATKIIRFGKKRVSRVQSAIFSLLNEHYMVRVVFADLFDATDLTKYKVVEMVGTHANLQMAEYVYEFLNRKLEDLWQDFFAVSKNIKAKKSYHLGIIRGFDDKLLQQKKQFHRAATNESKALTVIADNALNDFLEMKFPRLHKRSSSSSTIHSNAYHHGVNHGKQINISRPISNKGGFGGYLE